jgi:hypothetical protein
MELKEFVRLDPNQIRRDKELMQLFVNFYEAAFSFIPKCVGCAFKSGFRKLKKYAKTSKKNINFDKNIIEMESKTFVLKKQYQLKILSYKKDGVTHRCYGYNLTESFAKELVNVGKTDLFATLPTELNLDASISKNETIINNEPEVSKYDLMNHREELLPLYAEVKEKTGKKALSNKKEDIIAFLKENES